MKFTRGEQVIHETRATVGIVLGCYLDWDCRWFVVWRTSREVLYISPEDDLNWYPTTVHVTLDPETPEILPGRVMG